MRESGARTKAVPGRGQGWGVFHTRPPESVFAGVHPQNFWPSSILKALSFSALALPSTALGDLLGAFGFWPALFWGFPLGWLAPLLAALALSENRCPFYGLAFASRFWGFSPQTLAAFYKRRAKILRLPFSFPGPTAFPAESYTLPWQKSRWGHSGGSAH